MNLAQQDHLRPRPAKEHWFATTHWSTVLAAGRKSSPEAAAALERLCCTYWYPLYLYVRRQGKESYDAQDIVQEFFARLLGQNFLENVRPEKGKFRSFLLGAMNHFLANEWHRSRAEKRGGGRAAVHLDAQSSEERYQLEPVSDLTPEKIYERDWALIVLDQALARLHEEFVAVGKAQVFDQLKVFLEVGAKSGDYVPVGKKLHMAGSAVAVAVHRLRQRYRELVRAEIAHTVTSPADIEDEMQHLFAVLSG